jgi:hypothetical protein
MQILGAVNARPGEGDGRRENSRWRATGDRLCKRRAFVAQLLGKRRPARFPGVPVGQTGMVTGNQISEQLTTGSPRCGRMNRPGNGVLHPAPALRCAGQDHWRRRCTSGTWPDTCQGRARYRPVQPTTRHRKFQQTRRPAARPRANDRRAHGGRSRRWQAGERARQQSSKSPPRSAMAIMVERHWPLRVLSRFLPGKHAPLFPQARHGSTPRRPRAAKLPRPSVYNPARWQRTLRWSPAPLAEHRPTPMKPRSANDCGRYLPAACGAGQARRGR